MANLDGGAQRIGIAQALREQHRNHALLVRGQDLGWNTIGEALVLG